MFAPASFCSPERQTKRSFTSDHSRLSTAQLQSSKKSSTYCACYFTSSVRASRKPDIRCAHCLCILFVCSWVGTKHYTHIYTRCWVEGPYCIISLQCVNQLQHCDVISMTTMNYLNFKQLTASIDVLPEMTEKGHMSHAAAEEISVCIYIYNITCLVNLL